MNPAWILIDGFSLLHRDAECVAALRSGRAFEARRRLVQKLSAVAGRLAPRVTVVFDGTGPGGPGEEGIDAGVEVVFSPAHQTADTVIERMVLQAPDPHAVLVVTSDRRERETVEGGGGASIGCSDFIARMKSAAEIRPHPSGWKSPLGDRWSG